MDVQPGWEHFEHEADVGIRGHGRTMDEAFEQAARAMVAVAVELSSVRDGQRVPIRCAAPDAELLFVDWLNAVLYEMAARRMLFGRFEVRIAAGRLRGQAWGEPVDPARHRPAVEVKGASYAELKVAQATDGMWLAQCIVDV